MEFLKKSIHMDQIGCEEQTQITLEDDVNIADAKPDVYQVVTQQGHIELEEVRASDGHVHVKGVLHFKVLYLADEETHHPACMEGELAFEEQILMGSVSGTDQVQGAGDFGGFKCRNDQFPEAFGAGTFADPPVHGADEAAGCGGGSGRHRAD